MKTSTSVIKLIMRVAFMCLIAMAFINKSSAQISVSGGTGLASTYTSLTKSGGLFGALNANPSQSGNNIVVTITANVTNEDANDSLAQGNWASLTINPSGTRTISGATTAGKSLINFNGADNVTINGLNASGNSLTISNTTRGAVNTIVLKNDANNNTITNCTITGSDTAITYGVISFLAGASTGNDNNTISNNNIGPAGSNLPANAIYSSGTSASVDNNSNTISGNSIYDFFSAFLASSGIMLTATGNNTWTISNNKFYQTAARTYTTASTHNAINIAGGDGYAISGNTIGYASSTGTGTYTMTGTGLTRFIGINLSVGTTTASSVQGNTVAGIYLTSANTNGTTTPSITGIFIGAGNVNVGTVTANIIGSTSGTNSIVFNATASAGGTVGIYCGSSGTLNISNNKIGGMADTSATASFALHCHGIYIGAAPASITISNNTIGNSTANNMYAGRLGFTTANTFVSGIGAATTATSASYSADTIQNLASYGTSTGAYVRGIFTATTGSTAAATINNNTIRNLTTAGTLTGTTTGNVVAAGIAFGSGLNATIYKNTIYNIGGTNTSTGNYVVAGIVIGGAAQGVYTYGNLIYGLSNLGTGTTATTPPVVTGIAIRSGGGTGGFENIYNNMISLGNGQTTNTCFIGVWANHATTPDPVDSIYHNTINIEGAATSGALPSFCFMRGDLTATARTVTVVLRNNIFTNSRSGGTGKHYAIANNYGVTTASATGWTTGASNYNILNSASSATVGYWSTDKTLANWQTASSSDAASSSGVTVTYTNSANNLHINMGTTPGGIESFGTSTNIATDFDGDDRPGPTGSVNGFGTAPDLGADEFDGVQVYTCTTPSVNSVNASVTSFACSGGTTSLTLGSAVSGSGNNYQWQYSINGSSWSNISGATNSSYTASIAAANNYFRCGITCANGGGTIYSTSSVNITSVAALSGTYTINKNIAASGINYQSFATAFADLVCKGVTGPVVFNVVSGSGPYTEQVSLNPVYGASATNTVTINGNGNTLSFNSTTSATRTGIILNGADYITINNLVIDGSAGTYGWGILLTGGADYNTISNCTINVSTSSTTSTNHYGIVMSASTTTLSAGTNGSNNTITNDTINGGYYALAIYGNSTAASYAQSNTITNNIIKNSYLYPIYFIYQKNGTVSGNDISRPNRTTTSTLAGIYLTTGGGGNTISKNKIHNMFDAVTTNTSTFYGIYCSADGAAGSENLIANNLIYISSGTGTAPCYGIYNTSGAYMVAYHNTIYLGDATASTALAYGLYQTGAVAGIVFKNNLVSITRGGTGAHRCVYFNTTTSTITSNYNNFYINAGGSDNAVGNFSTTNYATLANWKTANSNAYDANSLSVNPQFVNTTTGDFTPNSGVMDNMGTNVGVTTDLLGNTRSNSTPDIGAIEYTGAGCDDPPTAGTATSSTAYICSGVAFTLDVTGASAGSGLTYQWQSSDDNSNWADIGSLQTTTAYSTTQTSATYYRVGVTCSGGTTVYSTSILINTPTSTSGTFTINNNAAASSSNFQSFTTAIAAISCGVNGPVVFNVVAGSGPYNEQVTIPSISGASATNTITINGNGRTLSFNSTNSNARAVMTLSGADYVTINNLNINGSGGTYGWGILLNGQADHNTISNCTISVSTSNTTSGNHYGIIASASATSATGSGNNANYTTVTGCTVSGGYYGVIFYGSTTAGAENTTNKVLNCTITDAYSYNIYLGYQKYCEAKGNNISRPTRSSSTTTAGVFVTSGGEGNLVSSNRIHNMFDAISTSTSTCYSIYISADGTVSNPIKVINNLVYNIGGNGPVYGIYNTTGNYMEAFHNTFALNDQSATSGTCYGVYQTGAVTSCVLKNNIIHISRTGTGIKHCLHFVTTTSVITSNNNNLYITSTGGTDNAVGYYSTAFVTLANWKTANSAAYDQNSLSTNSQFTDSSSDDYTPISGVLDNTGVPVGVAVDIDDNSRSGTNPDMGAIEFTGTGCIDPPTAGTAIAAVSVVCAGSNFSVDLSGNTTGVGQTYQWQISDDDNTWSDIGSPQVATSYTTTQSTSNYYRAAVTCGGGTAYSTSIYVTTIPQPSGVYTIDKTAPASSTNFTSLAAAISSLSCGIGGLVTFNVVAGTGPYTEQVTILPITGASATNTVTFNGNGNTILVNSSTTSARAAFTLNGADHIVINNFVIDATAGTYGWGVHFTAQADSNIVSNCTISVSTTNTTSANHSTIVISGSTSSATTTGNNGNYNTITGCTLDGGYYGVVLYGNSTTGGENLGNSLINNTITNSYSYAIYSVYQALATIRGNDISRPTRGTVTTGAGVYLNTGGSGIVVEKNKIHNLFDVATTSTSACYGVYVSTDGTSANPTMIVNNAIYNLGGNGIEYGIYNTTGSYMYAYHNTIVLNDQDATTGAVYGLYQTGATTVIYKNNIVSVSRSGTGVKRCIYLVTSTSTITSDYNDFIMAATTGTDNKVGAFTSSNSYATLTDWKTANSNAYDQNSVTITPQFVNESNGNFLPNAPSFNNLGVNVNVATDILGVSRSATTPDMGAYEFDAQGCTNPPTAGTVSVVSTSVCSGNTFTLSIVGNSYGQGQTYQWQSSSNNSSWTNLGSLLDSTSSYNTSQTASTYYRAALTCNGGTTVYTSSVYITTPALVSGTFTINKNVATGGSNFASFNEAVSYMSCGINAPIIFNVVSGTGPYNEQVTIPAIGGVSSTNTITFNGNGNTLSYSSSVSTSRHGILLNGADYVTINNLSIDVSAGTYGYGIILTANANNNTITNCTINAGRNVSSSNYAGIVLSGGASSLTTGNSGNNNTISNNTVYGGYYGIALDGNTTALQTGNLITGNTVIDVYFYNIYLLYQTGATVRGNEVYRTTTRTTYSTSYGVALSTGVKASTVDKNKIHDLFAGALTNASIAYCLYTSADGTVGNENKFTNNLVYNIKNNGDVYGVYNTSGAYALYYHNTFVLDYASTTTGDTYGFYQTGSVAGVSFKNNIVYVTRGGTGIKRCIYIVTSGTSTVSDYNDLYISANGSSDAYLGQYTSTNNYLTLANWKTANANAYDQNSLSIDPSFVSAGSGNFRPTTSSLSTLGTNLSVTDDILGATRSVTYTVGAYQNDVTAPSITYTSLTEGCGPIESSSRSLNGVVITDATGVPTTGGTVPRIYYKKGVAGSWGSAAGTLASGTATNSTWNFTITYSNIAALANGDSIYYFVAAQDVNGTINVGSLPSGAVGTSVNNITTYPTGNYFRVITYSPGVSISTLTTTVCSGSNVSFNATGTNTGSSPSYEWKRNGNSVGTGSTITFVSGTLSNGDQISCTLTANNTCQTSAIAISNVISLTVNPSPSVGQIIGTRNDGTNGVITVKTMCKLNDSIVVYNPTPSGTWSSSNPSVATVGFAGGNGFSGKIKSIAAGTATITYSLTATGGTGCISSSSLLITVTTMTAPNAITGNNTLCKGSTTQLSSTTSGGVWSSLNASYASVNSTGLVTTLSSGVATIKYTVTSGVCSANTTYPVTIVAFPNVPTISYQVGTVDPQRGAGGAFCSNKAFKIVGTPSSPGTGTWSKTGVIAIFPISTGVDSVNTGSVAGSGSITYTYTNSTGCSSSRTIAGNVVICASRGVNGATNEKQTTSNEFTMFPNPAKTFIRIEVKTLVGEGTIVVTDLYGKKVKTQALSLGNNTIDIAQLSKGFYMVSIITNEGKTTKKLVVE